MSSRGEQWGEAPEQGQCCLVLLTRLHSWHADRWRLQRPGLARLRAEAAFRPWLKHKL